MIAETRWYRNLTTRMAGMCLLLVFPGLALAPPLYAAAPSVSGVGYEQAPDLVRIYIQVNRSDLGAVAEPRVDGRDIIFYLKGFGAQDTAQHTEVRGDNTVEFIRVEPVRGGSRVRIRCKPGVTPHFWSASEKSVYFVEVVRPPHLCAPPQVTEEELARLREQGVKIVVIDPGHGGRDPGARSRGREEKDEVLRVSRVIRDTINAHGNDARGKPRMRAFLTRTGDYNLGSLREDRLKNRLKKAKQLDGDLLISVHMNAFRRSSASGWEIHIPRTVVNSKMARELRENPDQIHDYVIAENLNEDSDETTAQIIASVAADANEEFSWKWGDCLAAEVDAHLSRYIPKRGKHGTMQTNKFVTGSIAMPGVLYEVGFLTSPSDTRWMTGEAFQRRVAACVHNAAVRYFSTGDPEFARLRMAVPAMPKPAYLTHRVRRGDTLSKIASRYGVSLSSLYAANDLNSRTARRIRVGQSIRVPTRGIDVARGNGASTAVRYRNHTIRKGETLAAVARKYSVNLDTLLSINGLTEKSARRIQPGAVIKVPTR